MKHLLDIDKPIYGIDVPIQEMLEKLYDTLAEKWGTEKLDGYGRVYKNERDGELIPEVWKTDENQYKPALYNDQSSFFFVDSDRQKSDGYGNSTEIDIIFMLNLEQLFEKEKQRMDERVYIDAMQVLRESFEGVFEIETHFKGLETVFKRHGFSTKNIEQNDFQPYHVFSIGGTLEYFIDCND